MQPRRQSSGPASLSAARLADGDVSSSRALLTAGRWGRGDAPLFIESWAPTPTRLYKSVLESTEDTRGHDVLRGKATRDQRPQYGRRVTA